MDVVEALLLWKYLMEKLVETGDIELIMTSYQQKYLGPIL